MSSANSNPVVKRFSEDQTNRPDMGYGLDWVHDPEKCVTNGTKQKFVSLLSSDQISIS